MKLVDDFSVQQINEEYCKHYKDLHNNILTSAERKKIKNIIMNFREYDKEAVLKLLIVFSLFEPDYCIKWARRKGVFRYSEGNGNASYYLIELLKYKKCLLFSENTVSYLEDKLANKWMEAYFIKSEKDIKEEISQHYNKERIRKNIDGISMETSLILELMSYLEMTFRLKVNLTHSQVVNQRLFRNCIDKYTQEELSEAVSYLIYLNYKMIPIKEYRFLWLNTDYVNSNKIEQLILKACKRNQLIEWENMIDYLGYAVKKNGRRVSIYDPTIRMEKSIRLGYIKRQMQEQLLHMNFEHSEDEASLQKLAITLVDGAGEELFVFKNEPSILQRYQFQFPRVLIEELCSQDNDMPQLFAEEFEYVYTICVEQMISMEEFYGLKITEHCTAIDIILFKRFFTLFVTMQNYLWKNKLSLEDKLLPIMERSVIPTFREFELLRLITPFLKSEEKVKELLKLMTWNGNEKLDLQYTPILKLKDHYFLAADICVVSNSFRNVIVRARSRNNQVVNSDGRNNPLERKCEECFSDSSYSFEYKRGLPFKYNGKEGEIDFLAWSDNSFYVFECKNAILPTNTFELRTTFDYMEKAEQQLDLIQKALTDSNFQNQYFRNWNISDTKKKREIFTCILLGNRVFSTYCKGKHPVRYIYELDMVLNDGIIKSELGTWRYWKNETFSEEDLKLFLSEGDILSKSLLGAMSEYHEYISYMNKEVEYTSYKLDSYELIKKQDEYFTVISKNEELRNKIEKCINYSEII